MSFGNFIFSWKGKVYSTKIQEVRSNFCEVKSIVDQLMTTRM